MVFVVDMGSDDGDEIIRSDGGIGGWRRKLKEKERWPKWRCRRCGSPEGRGWLTEGLGELSVVEKLVVGGCDGFGW